MEKKKEGKKKDGKKEVKVEYSYAKRKTETINPKTGKKMPGEVQVKTGAIQKQKAQTPSNKRISKSVGKVASGKKKLRKGLIKGATYR
jgi:hypothetical protein